MSIDLDRLEDCHEYIEQLTAQLAEAQAEIERTKKQLFFQIDEAIDREEAALAQLQSARDALKRFGEHRSRDCYDMARIPPEPLCVCGLDTALESEP